MRVAHNPDFTIITETADYIVVDKKADEIVDILEYSGGNKLAKKFIIKKLKNLRIKLFKLITTSIDRK